jgi:hypothetical protein
MRLPKLRGFRNPFRVEYQVVNVGQLAELFPRAAPSAVDELVAAGAVRERHLVKVLGDGEVAVKLDVTAHASPRRPRPRSPPPAAAAPRCNPGRRSPAGRAHQAGSAPPRRTGLPAGVR